MCGIVGFTNYQGCVQDPNQILKNMLKTIQERGPDSFGTWYKDGVAIGHNRLTILDLTEAGHQPMVSNSGRYTITYNGEVYNAGELKRKLPPEYAWRGHSDTEVILAFIEQFGVEIAVKQFIGMFAFVVYDSKTQELHLVRDHLGIKPLYYGILDGNMLFGSQIKTFLQYPKFKKEISIDAMGLFFKYNYIPTPYAIYKNCYKLKPGHILTFKKGEIVANRPYWSMEEAALKGLESQFIDAREALESVEGLLADSISRQLIADVPVGVLLSGGIDSSLVACLAQNQIRKQIKTFTMGFYEKQYNEAHYASQVAKHLGTDHIEEYVSINKALDIIPEIPVYCDEPFADASQIPTLLVSRLARNDVKVVLSGDGGDEFNAGYSRYADVLKFYKYTSCLPPFVKKAILSTINAIPSKAGRLVGPQSLFKLIMASRLIMKKSIKDIYDDLFNFWPDLFSVQESDITSSNCRTRLSDLSYMQFHDSVRYLPDDILTKVDRCTMYASLEARVPFLDYRLVELSLRLPDQFKIRDRQTKWLLRQILYKYVPKHLIDRPKKGFAIPIDIWLKGPLKPWAMDLLNDIKNEGIIPFAPIKKCMDEHQNGYVNWQYPLWGILMWQNWKNYYK